VFTRVLGTLHAEATGRVKQTGARVKAKHWSSVSGDGFGAMGASRLLTLAVTRSSHQCSVVRESCETPKCRLVNARPEPDFRYFSKRTALRQLMNVRLLIHQAQVHTADLRWIDRHLSRRVGSE
jgi:hypothetical protein